MNHKILPSLAGVYEGFDGAIQKISLNGVVVDNLLKVGQIWSFPTDIDLDEANFQYSVLNSGISEYTGLPCIPNICKNGAQCVPNLDKFHCQCLSGYSGKHCEDGRLPRSNSQMIDRDNSNLTFQSCLLPTQTRMSLWGSMEKHIWSIRTKFLIRKLYGFGC